MEYLRKEYNQKKEKYRALKKHEGEKLRNELIKIAKEDSKNFEEGLDFGTVDGVPIKEHELFISRKELILEFWEDIWGKTLGKIHFKKANALVIPSKIILTCKKIDMLSNKKNLTETQVDDLINTYKKIFEVVKKIIEPYYQTILNKKEHLDWTDINKAMDKKYKKKLFYEMNGTLRNASGHESSFIEKNTFIWILDDGTEKEYPLEKIINKIIDLVTLSLLLYWGLSEIHINKIIEKYKIIPIKELEKTVHNLNI